MPARSGDQYLQGLRDRPGEVWLGGQRVADVTSHPGLSSGARFVAALYDMQLDPAHLEEMTFPLPGSRERVGMSFVTPRTQHELQGRRRTMDIACSSFGSRQALYERFFFGDPSRRAISLYGAYDKRPAQEKVREFIALG